jgi:hypothetical protein
MVNWKSKYLAMKLKYINAKYKGGSNFDVLEEDIQRLVEEAVFEDKVKLINEFLELTWRGYNRSKLGELTETFKEFNEQLDCCYETNFGRSGWNLNKSKIKENPNDIDFNELATIVERMKSMGLQKNPHGHEWDGRYSDE